MNFSGCYPQDYSSCYIPNFIPNYSPYYSPYFQYPQNQYFQNVNTKKEKCSNNNNNTLSSLLWGIFLFLLLLFLIYIFSVVFSNRKRDSNNNNNNNNNNNTTSDTTDNRNSNYNYNYDPSQSENQNQNENITINSRDEKYNNTILANKSETSFPVKEIIILPKDNSFRMNGVRVEDKDKNYQEDEYQDDKYQEKKNKEKSLKRLIRMVPKHNEHIPHNASKDPFGERNSNKRPLPSELKSTECEYQVTGADMELPKPMGTDFYTLGRDTSTVYVTGSTSLPPYPVDSNFKERWCLYPEMQDEEIQKGAKGVEQLLKRDPYFSREAKPIVAPFSAF